MGITAEHESTIAKYRAILSGMQLDTALAEACAKSEMSGNDPMSALRHMVEYQAVRDNTGGEVVPHTRQDGETEDLRKEIENYMLFGLGTAEFQHCKRSYINSVLRFRKRHSQVMLGQVEVGLLIKVFVQLWNI